MADIPEGRTVLNVVIYRCQYKTCNTSQQSHPILDELGWTYPLNGPEIVIKSTGGLPDNWKEAHIQEDDGQGGYVTNTYYLCHKHDVKIDD